jgi:hypothetical protein
MTSADNSTNTMDTTQSNHFECNFCKKHFGDKYEKTHHRQDEQCYWDDSKPKAEKWDCPHCVRQFGQKKYRGTGHSKETPCKWADNDHAKNTKTVKDVPSQEFHCKFCTEHFKEKYDGTHHAKETPCNYDPSNQNRKIVYHCEGCKHHFCDKYVRTYHAKDTPCKFVKKNKDDDKFPTLESLDKK